MKYFHCPKEFHSKPYGCGFGPVNATQAFLDMGNKCHCGKDLKPLTKAKAIKDHKQAEIAEAVDFVKIMYGSSAAKDYAKTKGVK